MKISYAITVCDEFLEIQKLIPFLLENKRQEDEIVILLDHSNGKDEVYRYLLTLPNEVQCYRETFQGHFADWKNQLTSYCTGDYIFQIDADEMPNSILLEHLPYMLTETPEADVILVPRINTVEGLTPEHIKKWGWNVNDQGWVNFPDYQWRIYRNCPEIKWVNKVHERLDGFKSYARLEAKEYYNLYHPKTIDKQVKQNDLYDQLQNNERDNHGV